MILGIIPARGGSKRIPDKNIKPFCGKPLIAWTIEAALSCGRLDDVMVSTDDRDIEIVAEQYGALVNARPAWLAIDTASLYDVVRYHLKQPSYDNRPDVVMLLHPTSPLRTADDIDSAVNRYGESMPFQSFETGASRANGAIYCAPTFMWRDRSFNFDTNTTVQRFEMSPERSIDINTPEDFARAERMKGAA